MSMSRADFTMLAEFLGQVQAGRIPLPEVIDEMVATLQEHLPASSLFKPEKFKRHAETQREIEQREARYIVPGDSFTIDGMLFRADAVVRDYDETEGNVRLYVKPDSAGDGCGHGEHLEIEFILDPECMV